MSVRVLDVSIGGVRIEHSNVLRPGTTWTFELSAAPSSLILRVRIVHSAVVGTKAMPKGSEVTGIRAVSHSSESP
jgi:hypothetical protein